METVPRQGRRAPFGWRIATFGVLMTALATASLVTASPVAHATLASPLTSAFLDSEPNDPAGGGQQLSLSTVTDTSGTQPGTTGSTTWNLSGSGHTATVSLASPLGQPLTAGTYENAAGGPRNADQPLITVTADGNTCTSFLGRFIVDEITTNVTGNLLTFSARFKQRCDGGEPALFGALSYNATADFRTVTISPSTVDFGTRGNDGVPSAPQTITITNNGSSTLTVFQTAITVGPSEGFSWTPGTCGPTPVTVAPGESCAGDVTFTGFGPEGPRTATLTIWDDLAPLGSTGRAVVLTGEVISLGSSSWESLGGFVNADPAATADSTGVYVVVRGRDRAYYIRRYVNGVWSGYQPLGGGFNSLPWVVSDEAGTSGIPGIHVFGIGLDDALYTGHLTNGTFSGWQSLGGFATAYPTAVVGPTGLDVALRGGDGGVYTRHLAGGVWQPYRSLGGLARSGTWLVSHPSGTYAFTTGGDLSIYWRNLDSGNWTSLGGAASSPPVAVRDGVGISYFIRGLDGGVYARQWNGTNWAPYENLGGYIQSAALAVVDTGGTSVFVVGGDGALYARRFENGTWKPWQSYGGELFSDPIATSVDSVDHVFMIGEDDALYTQRITFAPGASSAGADVADGLGDAPPHGAEHGRVDSTFITGGP